MARVATLYKRKSQLSLAITSLEMGCTRAFGSVTEASMPWLNTTKKSRPGAMIQCRRRLTPVCPIVESYCARVETIRSGRSGERRVGKEGRSRWGPDDDKKERRG